MRISILKGHPAVIANTPWNLWSGHQTSFGIWVALCEALKAQMKYLTTNHLPDLFRERVLLAGRYGFDPGAAWDALDLGFSPNAQGIPVATSPAMELLAAVGLQRFRPAMSSDRRSFTYATWSIPLASPIAACAASGAGVAPILSRFCGHVVNRGQYAALGYSTQQIGDHNE